jgi:DNA anti-recombination protein RmuC
LIASLISLLGAALGLNVLLAEGLRPLLRRILGMKVREAPVSYSEKMRELTAALSKASRQVDRTLQEMVEATRQREATLRAMEQREQELSEREKSLQEKIEVLEQVSLPAAEYFAKMTNEMERRSARRDYAIFGLGVIVTTVISIILRLFGI